MPVKDTVLLGVALEQIVTILVQTDKNQNEQTQY